MVLVVMKIKQKIKMAFSATLVVLALVALPVSSVFAASDGCNYNGAILNGSTLCNSSSSDPAQKSAVWGILLLAINILTAGVGIAAVGGLIYGAILWSAAGGNPGQVQKARQIITNVVIGIIAYALMFSFLNFLVPGGIFNK